MSYIKNIIEEEHRRLQALSKKYNDKIESFFKGTVSIKKRNNKEYLYIARRRGGKVQFKYIGPLESDKAVKIINEAAERKEYELKLKQVNRDLKEIGKIVDGKKI